MKNFWKILALTLLPASLWAATITGTVRDSTSNAAIANALVRVTVGGVQDTVRTNAGGTYTLTNANIVAGTYTVNFSATGYTTRNITGVTVASATSSTTLNVRLLTTTTTAGTITGTVRDSTTNAVIAGARVIVSRTGGGAFADTATTNAQGVYTITNANLTTGNVTVNVSATGYTTRNLTGIAITSGTTTTLNVRLLATTTTAGTITGTVSDSTTNAVIAGARVIVSRTGGGAFADTATTNAQGVYTITNANLTTGNVTVNVSATGYTTRNLTGIAITSGTTTTLNVRLLATTTTAGTVTGTITNANTNATIANVLVRVIVGGTVDSGRTNAQGVYTITNANLTAGTYTIVASATGYGPTAGTATVTAGGTTTLNLTLTPATALFGTNASARDIHFVQSGDKLTLELSVSNVARSIRVYGMNGKVQQNVSIPAGQSHVELPGAFAPKNGFLFQVK